jgi:hypothetical protein
VDRRGTWNETAASNLYSMPGWSDSPSMAPPEAPSDEMSNSMGSGAKTPMSSCAARSSCHGQFRPPPFSCTTRMSSGAYAAVWMRTCGDVERVRERGRSFTDKSHTEQSHAYKQDVALFVALFARAQQDTARGQSTRHATHLGRELWERGRDEVGKVCGEALGGGAGAIREGRGEVRDV